MTFAQKLYAKIPPSVIRFLKNPAEMNSLGLILAVLGAVLLAFGMIFPLMKGWAMIATIGAISCWAWGLWTIRAEGIRVALVMAEWHAKQQGFKEPKIEKKVEHTPIEV